MKKDILNLKGVKELTKFELIEIEGGRNLATSATSAQLDKTEVGDPSKKYECYFTHIGLTLYFSHYSSINESNGDNIKCYRSSYYS
ncbi:hypothetical protein MK851_03630 [Tenacibaculum sp. 1B UA]|uniref:hypothetical protein n=1 Tax=Tenacibaculum sp. 1B UA TaxID=2922252 RepID=UPI002A23BE61|nr:hypothetical protein [Tenacibaculum sp. 1B UA]MDX8552715.1 hypothetical protein [Tenacibaculum sp. 1B UA]